MRADGPAAEGGRATSRRGPQGIAPSPWHNGLFADAINSGRGPLFLRRTDGELIPLDVERWCEPANEDDMTVLQRCEKAVFDIGCGPGRMLTALRELGHTVLGIDVSPAAINRTQGNGGPALHCSVFDPVPDEGRWGTALLMDGNIGIGGAPAKLLERVAEIVEPEGLLLVELSPLDVDQRFLVTLESQTGVHGQHFPWAKIGITALLREARTAGWRHVEQWDAHRRSFVALRSTVQPR